MNYDVVVVGAGPIGAIASEYSAKSGAKTLLIEEHASIGSPVQCTGLISVKALEECGLQPSNSFVNREMRGAKVCSPGGHSVKIDGMRTRAYVIDRKVFDRMLVARALDSGVDIQLKTRATAIRNTPRGAVLTVRHGGAVQSIHARVVIGADGIQSGIARMCNLGRVGKTLSGIQIDGCYESEDPDFVEIFLGNSIAPGFFAWAVPYTESGARIGLCVNPAHVSPYEYLQRLLTEHPIASKNYKNSYTGLSMGGIPLGPLPSTFADAALVVGDAAGQVKPTSGGGIYMGAVCAKIAGGIASKGLSDKSELQVYERLWRKQIGGELTMGMHIHSALAGFSDQRLDEFIQLFDNEKMMRAVREYGDMDYPSIFFKQIALHLNKKQFFSFAGNVLRDFISNK